MSKIKKSQTYRDLRDQLQAEITWFDGDNDDVDEALAHYKKAKDLITQMQKYLEGIEAEFKSIDQSSVKEK